MPRDRSEVNKGPVLKFKLAHFSDVHLGPLAIAEGFRDFRLKRLIGITSWALKRSKLHDPAIAEALREDIALHKPDHIACTGDMINIAARSEFPRALAWLEACAAPVDLSYVPGNHDAYVHVQQGAGLELFSPFMKGDMRLGECAFPYVRLRRNVALIGLNTGLPQALHRASGQLGPEQLRDLAALLPDLKQRGYCRIIMIHHPPLPGLTPQRRALHDAAAFAEVIREHGAELVLYGHNHRLRLDHAESPGGQIPVMGVASASMRPAPHQDPAAWRLFSIDRAKGRWDIRCMTRQWDQQSQRFATIEGFTKVN